MQGLPREAGPFDEQLHVALVAPLAVLEERQREGVLAAGEVDVGLHPLLRATIHDHRLAVDAEIRTGDGRPLHRRFGSAIGRDGSCATSASSRWRSSST